MTDKEIISSQAQQINLLKEEVITLKKRLAICWNNYINDLAIAPDNNASERAIRIIKVKQKVSGQFKTGQHAFCVIRYVMDTLIKRNLEVIYHLNQIVKLQTE